ncbi:hypothetical protein SK128_004316 [Halocaridina rubra]|uniref:Uncharacterized protein n=1 Tax=Halocaridina rubra TaxID=373956 RepID=A0AAN9A292_HALRR
MTNTEDSLEGKKSHKLHRFTVRIKSRLEISQTKKTTNDMSTFALPNRFWRRFSVQPTTETISGDHSLTHKAQIA